MKNAACLVLELIKMDAAECVNVISTYFSGSSLKHFQNLPIQKLQQRCATVTLEKCNKSVAFDV